MYVSKYYAFNKCKYKTFTVFQVNNNYDQYIHTFAISVFNKSLKSTQIE